MPIWAFRYFPTHDGPSHLENAQILNIYADPDRSELREYYEIRQEWMPTWPGHFVLAQLMRVFPPLTAEKVYVSLYVLLLFLGMAYAITAVGGKLLPSLLLLFPFVYSHPLHMGFYSFCFGIAVFLLTFGYWWKHRLDMSAWRMLGLAGLFLLLYLAHVVALGVACVAIGTVVIAGALSGSVSWRSATRMAAVALLAALPALLLFGAFLGSQLPGARSLGPLVPEWSSVVKLVLFDVVRTFEKSGLIFSGSLALLFLGLLVVGLRARWRSHRWQASDLLLPVAGVFVLLYLFFPDWIAGGSFMKTRLALLPPLVLIPWFASQALGERAAVAAGLFAIAISIGLLAHHMVKYHEVNGRMREYVSVAPYVESGSTLLCVHCEHQGPKAVGRKLAWKFRPFHHAVGHIVMERRAVNLDNYEAKAPQFPIRYRPERNPRNHVVCPDCSSPELRRLDILAYSGRTGGSVDYVFLWGRESAPIRCGDDASLMRDLSRAYDLIHTSQPLGLGRLYRRRDRGAEPVPLPATE